MREKANASEMNKDLPMDDSPKKSKFPPEVSKKPTLAERRKKEELGVDEGLAETQSDMDMIAKI